MVHSLHCSSVHTLPRPLFFSILLILTSSMEVAHSDASKIFFFFPPPSPIALVTSHCLESLILTNYLFAVAGSLLEVGVGKVILLSISILLSDHFIFICCLHVSAHFTSFV